MKREASPPVEESQVKRQKIPIGVQNAISNALENLGPQVISPEDILSSLPADILQWILLYYEADPEGMLKLCTVNRRMWTLCNAIKLEREGRWAVKEKVSLIDVIRRRKKAWRKATAKCLLWAWVRMISDMDLDPQRKAARERLFAPQEYAKTKMTDLLLWAAPWSGYNPAGYHIYPIRPLAGLNYLTAENRASNFFSPLRPAAGDWDVWDTWPKWLWEFIYPLSVSADTLDAWLGLRQGLKLPVSADTLDAWLSLRQGLKLPVLAQSPLWAITFDSQPEIDSLTYPVYVQFTARLPSSSLATMLGLPPDYVWTGPDAQTILESQAARAAFEGIISAQLVHYYPSPACKPGNIFASFPIDLWVVSTTPLVGVPTMYLFSRLSPGPD